MVAKGKCFKKVINTKLEHNKRTGTQYDNEKKSLMIGLWCSASEKEIIKKKADDLGFSASKYLYNVAFGIRHKQRVLPADVLRFKAEVVRLGFNIDLIAKKIQCGEILSDLDKQTLAAALMEILEVMSRIKTHLK